MLHKPFESYSVVNTPGSTYTWFITNGTQITGGNTNSITVQWGAVLGNTTVKVIETTVHGCSGDTVSQQVTLPVTLLSFGAYK
ncbi:MAG: hypothetical protein MUF68_09705, partial [Cyclobacteriaceae bacterium]|nr:hypothetical protein [Cyclobacteriaceae bacterium]